jgi:hypothetical protein
VGIDGLQEASDASLVLAIARYHEEALAEAYRRHGAAVDLLRSETSRRRREEREARQTAQGGYDIEREVIDLAVGEHVKEVVERLPVDKTPTLTVVTSTWAATHSSARPVTNRPAGASHVVVGERRRSCRRLFMFGPKGRG